MKRGTLREWNRRGRERSPSLAYMNHILSRENLILALKRVERNKGSHIEGVCRGDDHHFVHCCSHCSSGFCCSCHFMIGLTGPSGEKDTDPALSLNVADTLEGVEKLDKWRGHSFVRYADDFHIYVSSKKATE